MTAEKCSFIKDLIRYSEPKQENNRIQETKMSNEISSNFENLFAKFYSTLYNSVVSKI